MIWGAIVGDIAGSVWEFHPCMKEKPRELITEESFFTDDTVMTVAIADAIMHNKAFATTMRGWAFLHHHFKRGGYGARFIRWICDPEMGPYNSCGNGSAMRVSSCAWVANNLDAALTLAEASAAVTHNHPEGIKGAKATAGAIYLARTGHSKDEIREFVEGLGYDLSRTCDEIRPGYTHIETCQESIPEAITAFLESTSFEDCLKLCISLGGDADTLCAIAGAIAEGFYGVPEYLIDQARAKLTSDMLGIIDEFESNLWKGVKKDMTTKLTINIGDKVILAETQDKAKIKNGECVIPAGAKIKVKKVEVRA